MMSVEKYVQLTQFYQVYSDSVDSKNWQQWLDMFTESCIYRIQSRDNYERQLPMAALSLCSKGMLKDRIYGITETIFHDPYLQRHIVSSPLVFNVSSNIIESSANYAVYRTKNDGIAEIYNVGRYIDRIRDTDSGLKIESRICVFDNDMILNSLIYPI